ncbi:MAG: fumarylacetoacetate hydrolase family protein [Acidobacteriota bacterium]
MTQQIVRYRDGASAAWGLHRNGDVVPLEGNWRTTGEFLTDGGSAAALRASEADAQDVLGKPIESLDLLSPVTVDGDLICQGMNYASHLREIGRDPASARHNILFHKASSSLCGAREDVIRPRHVRALDYEVELGLVVGRKVSGPIDVTLETLHEFVGALVVTNDVSARDVQFSHEQFCKAKSYRTFAPTGPFLVLLEPSQLQRWHELVLTLSVNGETRQEAPAGDMVHGPVETLRELSEIRDLSPGDLIATGTPAGVALKAPGKLAARLAMLLPPERRAEIIARRAEKDPAYLRPGDVIRCGIRTPDGAIDLGTQENRVVAES